VASVDILFCGNVTNIMKHTDNSVELYQAIINMNKLDMDLYLHALDLYCKSFIRSSNAACLDPKFPLYYAAFQAPGSDYFQICDDIFAKKF
jgi:hypothetical protein